MAYKYRNGITVCAQYPHIYKALRLAGHDAFYALRILIDARRGDKWALDWIKTILKWRHLKNAS
jgi:hypothetical protein